MEKSRKQKVLLIFVLMLSIASLSIGFAAFSVSLNISSSASVSPSSDTFNVKFSISKDSLVVGSVQPSYVSPGVNADMGIIDNSSQPKLSNLSATFTQPGQYVEYTFYARNVGEYTAYLNSVSFFASKICKAENDTTDMLVQNACESINISVSVGGDIYNDSTAITGHSLESGFGEEVKVILEYDDNGDFVDGPFSISFPYVLFVYSTIDDSTTPPHLPNVVNLVSGNLDTLGSEICIDTECFYVISSNENEVTLLSKYNLYVGYECSIPGECISYGQEATEKQNSSMIGAGTIPIKGTIAFGYNYWQSYVDSFPSYVYNENSELYNYVEDYMQYLETFGVTISGARVITYEELINLGCSQSSCSAAPNWVYATSYWTGSAYNEASYVWSVSSDGCVGVSDSAHTNYSYGIRPVIIIPKSEF